MSWLIDGKTNGPDLSWPDGKRIAVMVTFDYDAEFLRISRAESKGTSIGFTDYSRGQYGPHEGLARCLAMLDAVGIKSTFFVPGIVAERRGISREEEVSILEKSESILKGICGRRPVGHRGPESIIHPFTSELLAERGYLYSSSMKDCDWAYLWEKDGNPLPLVELPCDITMDDFTYYYFTFSDPAVRSMYTNREVYGNWKQEFDGLALEGNKIFILKLHPQMIGRASRIGMVGELIAYMQSQGAWIATCEDVARYVLAKTYPGWENLPAFKNQPSHTQKGGASL